MKGQKPEKSFVVSATNLEGAVFHNVNLSNARFEDVNLSGVAVNYFNGSKLRFSDGALCDATIVNCSLSGLAVVDCKLDGMTIDGIAVSDLMAHWTTRAQT